MPNNPHDEATLRFYATDFDATAHATVSAMSARRRLSAKNEKKVEEMRARAGLPSPTCHVNTSDENNEEVAVVSDSAADVSSSPSWTMRVRHPCGDVNAGENLLAALRMHVVDDADCELWMRGATNGAPLDPRRGVAPPATEARARAAAIAAATRGLAELDAIDAVADLRASCNAGEEWAEAVRVLRKGQAEIYAHVSRAAAAGR